MRPVNSIFGSERSRGLTAIGAAAVAAIVAVFVTIALTGNGLSPAEADSLAAPQEQALQGQAPSNTVFVKITANGNELIGESQFFDRDSEQWTDVLEFNNSITVQSDRSSGLATGRRQHSPIVITKRIDKSTPLLMQALANNEVIELEIEFERRNQDEGFIETYYRVETTDGRITGIRKNAGLLGGDTETISFTYQTIIEEQLFENTQAEVSVHSNVQ